MRLIAAALLTVLLSPGVFASDVPPQEAAAIETAVNAYFKRHMPYIKNGIVDSHSAYVKSPTMSPWSEEDRSAYEVQNSKEVNLETISLLPSVKVGDLNAFGSFEEFSWEAFKKAYGDNALPIRVARPVLRKGAAIVRFETVSESESEPGRSSKSIPVDVFLEQAGDSWRVANSRVNF